MKQFVLFIGLLVLLPGCATASGTETTWAFILRKNAMDTTCSIVYTPATCGKLATMTCNETVAAGDRISIKIIETGNSVDGGL